mgnify:FL=1
MDEVSNKLRTTKQAAEYLGIKEHTFKNLFYASDMKEPTPTKLGGRTFFTTDSLDNWVQSNTQH